MARIAGINIPQNKVVHVALTYIHGIGKKFSNKQPGKPIEVFFHQRQPESITPDEIDEKTNWRGKYGI